MKLNVCHLYPDLMDTYGDKGNITCLKFRAKARNIEINVQQISIGDNIEKEKFDLIFFGGGQDRQQLIVEEDIQKKSVILKSEVENGIVFLSICGGYQLLQNYFKTSEGDTIRGISIFDAHTIGSTTRMVQNLLIKINPKIQKEINSVYSKASNHQPATNLVGFENHSGKTYLGKNIEQLGEVVVGAGNNGEDRSEGAVYKNAFGCYLHGSLLPKNPHFADFLIAKALKRRYGNHKLEKLDDSIEWQAHREAVKIC